MGCLEVVFCGKSLSFHQGSMSRGQRKSGVEYILAELRKGVKSAWLMGWKTVRYS